MCVDNGNLHPVLRRFQDIADYGQIFAVHRVPLFSALVRGENP